MFECREHPLKADSHGIEFRRIDGNFVLFKAPAPGIDFHNARDAGKLPFNDPILDGPQVRGRIAVLIPGFGVQYILVDLTQARADWPHFGASKTPGNLLARRFDLLGNKLPRQVGPHGVLKDDGDHRQAKLGNRTYLDHPW